MTSIHPVQRMIARTREVTCVRAAHTCRQASGKFEKQSCWKIVYAVVTNIFQRLQSHTLPGTGKPTDNNHISTNRGHLAFSLIYVTLVPAYKLGTAINSRSSQQVIPYCGFYQNRKISTGATSMVKQGTFRPKNSQSCKLGAKRSTLRISDSLASLRLITSSSW